MGFVRGFAQFWYDFIIGDDWKIAASVVLVLTVGAVLVVAGLGDIPWLTPLLAAGIAGTFVAVVLIDVRPH